MRGFRTLICWVAVLASLAVYADPATARAAGEPQVDGWTIVRSDQSRVCVAGGPSDGQASLSIAVEGPLFTLMVEAPDFPMAKDSYTVELAFDDKPPVQAPALGDGGVIGVNFGRGEPARILAAAAKVSFTVDGHTHHFSLRNAAAALDAVARCAGEPTLSEQVDAPPAPIPGAPGWTLALTLPGVAGPACMARIAGDQIDTMMVLNRDGDLLLIGGHSDWATWGGDVQLQLAVDDAPPVKLTATTLNNLILTLVKDPQLLQRLRQARTLEWTIPTGDVRGQVAGLGVALDAVTRCHAEAAPTP